MSFNPFTAWEVGQKVNLNPLWFRTCTQEEFKGAEVIYKDAEVLKVQTVKGQIIPIQQVRFSTAPVTILSDL